MFFAITKYVFCLFFRASFSNLRSIQFIYSRFYTSTSLLLPLSEEKTN